MSLSWKMKLHRGNRYIVKKDHGILKAGMILYCVFETDSHAHFLSDRPIFPNQDMYNNYFEIKLNKDNFHLLSLI